MPNIPEGLVAPKNSSWSQLVVWLLLLNKIPSALIPAAADLMRSWMVGLMGWAPYSKEILTQFHDWLVEIETAKYQKSFQDRRDPFGGGLSSGQLRNLEGNLRIYFCLFSDKVPDLAAQYLNSVSARNIPAHIITEILKMSGALAKAAPKELSALTINALIPDQSSRKRRREDYDQGLSFIDTQFMPESPAQGPFFVLLTHRPEEGLKLIYDLVNHVIDFQIKKWDVDEESIIVPFDAGDRVFRYPQSFHWSRRSQCHSVTSALMALEAWGHKRVEKGTSPMQVVLDILEPETAPVAVLTVAIDVLLSSDQTTYADVLPFLASPELVALDRTRPSIQDPGDFDFFGLSLMQQEPTGEVSKSYLKGKPSRQTCLEQFVQRFAFRAGIEMREKLVQKLKAASERLGQPEVGDSYADPRLMALYLRCQLDLQNYEEKEFISDEGEPIQLMEFKVPSELALFTDPLDKSLKASIHRVEESNIEMTAGHAVENPSMGTPELAAKAAEIVKPKTSDDRETLNFIAATAMLVLRDGDGELKASHGDWAVEKLTEFGTQDGDYHDGAFSVLRYNRAALALTGLSYALKTPLSGDQIRPILGTAAKHGQAIAAGLHNSLEKIEETAPKLIKSIVRVAVAGRIFPWRDWQDEEEYEARKTRSELRINEAIDAEINWILGDENEPEWPELPPVEPKIRHGIRIGRKPGIVEYEADSKSVEESRPNPDKLIFDDGSVARIITASMHHRRARGGLLEVLDVFWPFTSIKNGAGTENARVEPPREWNDCYYALLAEAMALVPKTEALFLLTERLTALPDDSFLGAVSSFLQHLDDMTFERKAISMELAVEFREAVSNRMMLTNSWKRLVGDRFGSMSTKFRPAISSLFFNSADSFSPATSRLLEPGIRRIDPAIPLLVKCISSAPSNAIAHFTMNLVEVVFMPSHKPMVLALVGGCLKIGIEEREFWIETKLGARICNYFESLLSEHDSPEKINQLSLELDDILNQFILIGVPEAQQLHDVLNSQRT